MTERVVEHVSELRRRSGNRRGVDRAMVAHGLTVSTAGVPEGAEVMIAGSLEAIPNGVVVDGLVVAPWTGECRRCLTEVSATMRVEVREVFETHATEGETWPLQDDELDLAPMLRDTVLLSLPLAPLCEAGCLGPAPDDFPTVASGDRTGDESAEEAPRDPRWAVLDLLRTETTD